jgi:hypothetical protein
MIAALPARLPFEVLHRVRDVNLVPFDSRFLERAIEKFARRTDERFSREVFLVARLLSE